ncbi:hypothetical protein [Tellurirhabdus bombi]|uniref:hypothetical protein n=1 Tax=Tellurirhabdus bombi TaxID=2907205 RepID=UPI001F38EF8F|nr:hypothetical protein [Tellurirhabdus bombi]
MPLTRYLLLTFCFFLTVSCALAQKMDSVTIKGRIKNLTVDLYRQSPTVSVSRSNILQASREMTRTAQLEPDGSFQLTLPKIYPYEEMYFRFSNVSSVFLASSGTIEIGLDADSLYVTELPFRFGGNLANVNNQLARFKAYEAKNRKPADNRRLQQRLERKSADGTFLTLVEEFSKLSNEYKAQNTLQPLLNDFLTSTIRYEAATYLFDKYTAEELTLPASVLDSLRPAKDPFMSIARATAYDRLSVYLVQKVNRRPVQASNRSTQNGLAIQRLAELLLRYGSGLTNTEKSKLNEIISKGGAQNKDLPLINRVYERNADTLSKLVPYEALLAQIDKSSDSTEGEFLTGQLIAQSWLQSTLNETRLTYAHFTPRVSSRNYKLSFSELYNLQIKDSAAIRGVNQLVKKQASPGNPISVMPGVALLDASALPNGSFPSGRDVANKIREQGRGRLIYVITWSDQIEQTQDMALQAQSLAEQFRNDLLVVYLCAGDLNKSFWQEWVARNKPRGLHVFAPDENASEIMLALRTLDMPSAALLGRDGKFIKRQAPLPDKVDEIQRLIREKR